MVQETHASVQDFETLSLDAMTSVAHQNLFHVHPMPIMPLRTKDESKLVEVTFEMELDRIEISRSRFTGLDLLAQFGGFMGIFRWIFTTFMAAWNTNALDNFMVTKLYKVRSSADEDKSEHQND